MGWKYNGIERRRRERRGKLGEISMEERKIQEGMTRRRRSGRNRESKKKEERRMGRPAADRKMRTRREVLGGTMMTEDMTSISKSVKAAYYTPILFFLAAK